MWAPRPSWLQRTVGLCRALLWPLAFLWVRLIITLTRPLLVFALRTAVRSRTFWLRGLASSWSVSLSLCMHQRQDPPQLASRGQVAHGWCVLAECAVCAWRQPLLWVAEQEGPCSVAA